MRTVFNSTHLIVRNRICRILPCDNTSHLTGGHMKVYRAGCGGYPPLWRAIFPVLTVSSIP